MSKKLMDKKWDSLAKLKDHFEKTNEETVTDYDGYQLKTKKHRYTLAFGELRKERL
jgi:hypothetical protein